MERKIPRRFLEELGMRFNREELMLMALTHPSYAQERNTSGNNQRLEFLGDAVLNLAVAEYLYTHFGNKAEGELTKIRARLIDFSPFRPALVFTGMTLTSFGNTHLGTSFLF